MSEALPRVAFVTSEQQPATLVGAVADEHTVDLHRWNDDIGMIEPEVLVKLVVADEPLVVCVAADVPGVLALDLCRLIDQEHPDIGVVLVRKPTPALWREAAQAGVRDVIQPDAIATELLPAVQRAAERAERIRAALALPDVQKTSGRIIVVLSPKGGSGKTMVASNLAVALATTNSGATAIVDFDCVFGDVATALNIVPAHTVGQLVTAPTFDSTLLKVFLERHERSGLHVLAGSGLPEDGEAVTDEVAGRVLDMLARDFAYVVVDTAAGIDERALAAIEQATDLVLVATMDVASIRNLGKEISTLDRLGIREAKRHFVLNRADARVGLEMADVEAAVGMTATVSIPSSRIVPLAMNQGRPIVLDEPDSTVARGLTDLAAVFVPSAPADGRSRGEQRSRSALARRWRR
jgi:pilus assembly protein CpaE